MEDLNATITKDPRYFVQKLSDPELAGCNPDILWSDVEVSNFFYSFVRLKRLDDLLDDA